MPEETITGAEFGRFRTDLSARLDRQDRAIDEGFRGVHLRQDVSNGRTTKNAEGLIRLEEHLDTIEQQVESINEKAERVAPIAAEVSAIHLHGCAKLEEHHQTVADLDGDPAGWDRRKKLVVGGGLLAGGAALWPVLQGILAAAHALLDHLAGH